MRVVAMLVLLLVLAGGIGASYVIYRLMETKTVALAAGAAWVNQPDGSRCLIARFDIESRTNGVWYLDAPEDVSVSGTVAVIGSADEDVGLRVYSPVNRAVYRTQGRTHEASFQFVAEVRGDYRFEIDNRHSAFAAKDVTLSACES